MKAITLWQPWASLWACGAKKYETRSWATNYRGPIAIHAAARKCDTRGLSGATVHAMIQAIRPITAHLAKTIMYLPLELLPLGSVIATAELIGCWLIRETHTVDPVTGRPSAYIDLDIYSETVRVDGDELLFGDWTPGRYAWEITNLQLLPEPIPAKGKQGLWNWEGIAA